MKLPLNFIVISTFLALLSGYILSAEDKPSQSLPDGEEDSNQSKEEKVNAENPDEKPKPKTYEVKRQNFEVKVTLNGILESSLMEEVTIATKSWAELTVLNALAQGAEVKKGDSLVTLDLEKIDDRIRSARQELAILDLDRQIMKADLKLAEFFAPMELKALERKNKETKEDLARYLEIYRPFNTKSAEFNLKSYKDSLAYAQEELRQLKKMYEADDLTEETEEIILQRAENAVARSMFSLEAAKIRNEDTLGFQLPREDIAVKEAAARNELALQAARKIRPAELEKKQLEAKKLERQREKASDVLERLQEDRKAMKVPSPVSGIVYRGTFDRGKWSGASPLKNRLRRGGAIKPHEVFMTIVGPKPLFVRSTVGEKDLRRVQPKAKGEIEVLAYPDLMIEGTVRKITRAPVAPGKFGVVLDVPLPEKSDKLLPGMSCTIKIISYRSKNAITVPSTAVFREEDSDTRHVLLFRKGKKPAKKIVQTGEKSGGQIEITKGLKQGQKIYIEKPKK